MTTPSIADLRYKSTEHSAFSCSSRAVVTHFSTPTGIGRIVLPETWPCTWKQQVEQVYSCSKEERETGSAHLVDCALQAMSLHVNKKKTKKERRKTFTIDLGRRTLWLTCLRTSCATLKEEQRRAQDVPCDDVKINDTTHISGHPLWLSVLERRGTKISSTRHDNWSMERVAKSPVMMNAGLSSRGTSIGRRLTK